jgi:hypothetical protein
MFCQVKHPRRADSVIDIEVALNPAFVDNTYGTGAVGWSPRRGHTFRDLYVSDHVEVSFLNGAGDTVFYGRLDLLEPTTAVPQRTAPPDTLPPG